MGDSGVSHDGDRVEAYVQKGGVFGYVHDCVFDVVEARDETEIPRFNKLRRFFGGGEPRYILEPVDGYWLSQMMPYRRLDRPYSDRIASLLRRNGYLIRGENRRVEFDRTYDLDDPVDCLCNGYDFVCPVCVADHLDLDYEEDTVTV